MNKGVAMGTGVAVVLLIVGVYLYRQRTAAAGGQGSSGYTPEEVGFVDDVMIGVKRLFTTAESMYEDIPAEF